MAAGDVVGQGAVGVGVVGQAQQFLNALQVQPQMAAVADKADAFQAGLVVAAVALGAALRGVQQAEFFVMADAFRRAAGASGDVADAIFLCHGLTL